MSRRSADSSSRIDSRMNGRTGGDGESPRRSSPASSKKTLEWVALERHPIFGNSNINSSRSTAIIDASGTTSSSSSVLQNLLAWDAGSSRLYLWDAGSQCVHRLAMRFRDPDPASRSTSFSAVVVEAAFPSEIFSTDIDIQATVHDISLNTDGSTLLLTGSEGLSVMHLYERTYSFDGKISCRTVLVGSRLFSSNNNGLRILQATWHPYSSNHLGVLSSDSVLRLFDLSSDLERAEQEFYLQPELGRIQNTVSFCPIAFSFGGQHLWERFSVFILYSNGSLYILCPIVPFGSFFSLMHVKEIYKDAHVGLDSSNPTVARNSGLAITWLEATFPELVERKMEEESVFLLRAHPYTPIEASLALQGPLVYASYGEKTDEPYVSVTGCEGKPVNFLYCSIGKDSVVVIAWSSGLLQIDALVDEAQPLWKAGSSPHFRVDTSGNIEGVAVICQSDLEESAISHKRVEHELANMQGASAAVSYRDPLLLLKLAIVDLSLPKNALNRCLLSLFPDPLVSERFYCLHSGGVDMIIIHCLPFSNMIPEMGAATSSVCPILTTSHSESSPQALCGYAVVADSYGHSQFVGVTPTNECLVLEMKGWNEMLPSHFDLDMKPFGSTETIISDLLSKELLSGPKAIIIPPSTSLRSLTPDSIEGRSTLHHYIKLFHENYVEYAHKVYIELEQHGEYVKTITDTQLKRLKEVEQRLSKLEKNEKGVEERISRAFKVYELLEQRLKNFEVLPAANKKPLSKAEREFNADLDRITDLELDEFHSAIDALNTRLKRYLQTSAASLSNTAKLGSGRRKNYVPNDQVSQLKSALSLLSNINSENVKKVKLIEDRLESQQE
ncbi:hypothetical protein KFK09_017086 [Dendrobium nobile]|uniref:Nuclear pore complex protein NUP88 n=1 Tax=Dendrobium nobile TaxID=94219 RepID=A0A8T3B0H1_DENNO|nr:hypothetical protein KFK09_017086 [Dendrobium nobile]